MGFEWVLECFLRFRGFGTGVWHMEVIVFSLDISALLPYSGNINGESDVNTLPDASAA